MHNKKKETAIMHNNKYTQAVDGIRAPEDAVDKMIETARTYRPDVASDRPKTTVSRRRLPRYAIAAVLALAVALSAIVGPGLFPGKSGLFTITVYAAELAEDSPVCLEAGAGSMNIVGKDGGTEYYVTLPFGISGEHVSSVTYSTDKDMIAVICPKDQDPVTAGEKTGEGTDTLFDAYYAQQQEKASGAAFDRAAILSRKYSSVTIDAGHQIPAMAIVGSSSKNASAFYEQNNKEETKDAANGSMLEERAERQNELIGNTIHCTVRFDDGSKQQIAIRVSAAVMLASAADPKGFAGLSAEEKAMKDHTGVFVVYSIVR